MTLTKMTLHFVLPFSVLLLAGCPDASKSGHGSEPSDAQHSTKSDAPPGPNDAGASGVASADTVVGGRARDPVCGMTIAVAGKPEFLYRDTTFHFCSADCLEKFKAAPAKAVTGLPKEECVCTVGEMQDCDCGHCKGHPERCTCGDPKAEEAGDGHGEHDEHDHGSHGDHDHSEH